MKYTNIFYIPHFNIIGGIETYAYELAKKYKDKDITFVYSVKDSDGKQLNRIRQYARVLYIAPNSNEKIKCKRLFIMYRCNLDLFEADEIIQIIHADYKAQSLKPNKDERIDKYYGVSKAVADIFKELSGKDVKVCYNPLTLEKPKKILKLISATRLTKEKGKERMIKLANELDKAKIPYEWRIFTNDTLPIPNENVLYMKPRLDIRDYIADSDYLVQLSDTEAFSYSVLESLSLGTPVIVTNIPSFKEMGVKNGINGYILDFSMKDIPIHDIYEKVPKFTFKAPKDIYDELIIDSKSTYNPKELVQCRALRTYTDRELKERIRKDQELPCKITLERAEELMQHPNGKLIEIIGDD
jgi:glycosyltransferase involved in cell wall biosynthesis